MTDPSIPTFGSSQHLDDEWVYGQLCRQFTLSGEGSPHRFLKRYFGECSSSLEAQMRVVIESECFGSRKMVAETATFQSYFQHFVHEEGVRWRTATPDLYTVGRCYNEKGTVARGRPAVDGLRDCAVCTKEQFTTQGIITWTRAHNLPGVRACWRHATKLRARFDFDQLPLPDPTSTQTSEAATEIELWFANVSRETLHDDSGSRRYARVLRGSVESYRWTAQLIAKGIVASYPPAILFPMDLTPRSLTAGYRSMLSKNRSIGDTRLLILLGHCEDRTSQLINGERFSEASWGAWRKAALAEGATPPRLDAWVEADRLEPFQPSLT